MFSRLHDGLTGAKRYDVLPTTRETHGRCRRARRAWPCPRPSTRSLAVRSAATRRSLRDEDQAVSGAEPSSVGVAAFRAAAVCVAAFPRGGVCAALLAAALRRAAFARRSVASRTSVVPWARAVFASVAGVDASIGEAPCKAIHRARRRRRAGRHLERKRSSRCKNSRRSERTPLTGPIAPNLLSGQSLGRENVLGLIATRRVELDAAERTRDLVGAHVALARGARQEVCCHPERLASWSETATLRTERLGEEWTRP
jgi:hypothetical protein